ncbi:MAG TPA: ABC transporter ATP-binding protein [Candidatus Binatia bacterium]|nr:ABC transporter ATP-binding protein [Candidatus Binatia bacterium]
MSDVAAAAGRDRPEIRLRGLRKHFGERTALDDVSLAIAGAQIVGVVGPDGAGKTTLLRAIAGLLEIEAEEASVLGFDLRGDVTDLKSRLGYVPQSFSLYRELTVEENLRVIGRLNRLDESAFDERARPLLERTGLAPFTDRQAGALSGGMKQKLAIAAALLPRPSLLVLDEPTAGVDVLARDEIWSILQERKSEVLIAISTSYLEEVEACDRLVYLDGGRVVATGTPAELRARVPLELYRAWGDDPRAIARAARALPYVDGARATGSYARIEVRCDRTPGAERVLDDLARLRDARVALAEQTPIDTESTLLALARGDHLPAGSRGP